MLRELLLSYPQPTLLFCDSRTTLHISSNQVFHEIRTEYIEINCHVVREKILAKVIHVSSKHQLADIFTMPLGFDQFQTLLGKMGINNIYTLFEGAMLEIF